MKTKDPYFGKRIVGQEIGVFEPFGPMYAGPETYVFYQGPAAYDVDVCLDRGWIVLCLGPCRSTAAIGSDRKGVAEAYRPSITYMPADCDVRVNEDTSRTSDLIIIVPPPQSFEEKEEMIGGAHASMHYFWSEDNAAGHLARSLRTMLLLNEKRFIDPLEIEISIDSSIARLLELYESKVGKGHKIRNFGLAMRQIRRVSAFVDANLDRTITLEGLATVVGLSRHQFARQFRGAMGTSAYDHVLSMRITKAMALLANSQHPLSEIAVTCGFYDNAHMSHQFARRVGVSPVDYRRIIQN